MEILTVCTGNICRSPLAELVLATRLSDVSIRVSSAGVQGLDHAAMTPGAVALARRAGVTEDAANAHRSRRLTPAMLTEPDLILAMTREHRRAITALAPARLRHVFTVREFARLAAVAGDAELERAASAGGQERGARLRAVAAHLASLRGIVDTPTDGADDDVIDPYRQSAAIYERSGEQMAPGLDAVERVVRRSV